MQESTIGTQLADHHGSKLKTEMFKFKLGELIHQNMSKTIRKGQPWFMVQQAELAVVY